MSSRKQQRALTDEELQEIREAFELFDADESQTIDADELEVAAKALGFEMTKKEITSAIAAQNSVDFAAFSELMGRKIRERDPTAELRRAFDLLDSTRKGYIAESDLRKAMKSLEMSTNGKVLR
jgi:Ca2+-binding EF-hand superfamily protein